jgi:hypothetical protein
MRLRESCHRSKRRVPGTHARRAAARPASTFATLRAHAMKRSVSGVSVRPFTVMNPTGAGGDKTFTGRILRRVWLPAKRMTDAGMRASQRPVSMRRR